MKGNSKTNFEKSEDELDTELVGKLQKLGAENKYKEYLDLLNENLAKVEIEESNEELLYLPKYLSQDIFIKLVTDLKLEEDKNEQRLFLRKGVIERLNEAQKSLPQGYHLAIGDALRTEEIVLGLYRYYFDKKKKEEPGLSDEEIDLWLRNVLAMPDDPVPPGHMTGGAVDVSLADDKGEKIPLEVDKKVIPGDEQSFTFCPKLPADIKEKRKILYDALINVGFYNYSREYWHYFFGDAYWAVRRKTKKAIYGIARDDLLRR